MGTWSTKDYRKGKLSDGKEDYEAIKPEKGIVATTPKTPNVLEKKSTTEKFAAIQHVDSNAQLENMRTAIDHGLAFVDSTTKDLRSYMKGMFANEPEPEIRSLQLDKVQTAVIVARQINELMKTKLEFINSGIDLSEQLPKDLNFEEKSDM